MGETWVRLVKVVFFHSQQQVRWFLLYIHLRSVRPDTFCLGHGGVCDVLLYSSSIGDTVCSLLGNVQAVIGSAQARMRVEGSGRQEPPRAPLSILGFGGKPLVSTNKTINPSDLIDVLLG